MFQNTTCGSRFRLLVLMFAVFRVLSSLQAQYHGFKEFRAAFLVRTWIATRRQCWTKNNNAHKTYGLREQSHSHFKFDKPFSGQSQAMCKCFPL